MNRLSAILPPPYRAADFAASAGALSPSKVPMTEQRLPFTVRIVNTESALSKAVSIRAAAYGRHMPEFGEKLRTAESDDTEPGVAVLLAESKLDGSPLGTLRIQSNAYMPLKVEQSVELPRWLRDRPLAEVSRLGIVGGTIGRLVKIVLIKAAFQYCEQDGIDWAIIGARAPLDRQYEQLLFEDLYPDRGFMTLRHINDMPHRVMGFEIGTGEQRWSEVEHPLLNFFVQTLHSDINIQVERELNFGGLFSNLPQPRVSPPLGRRPV